MLDLLLEPEQEKQKKRVIVAPPNKAYGKRQTHISCTEACKYIETLQTQKQPFNQLKLMLPDELGRKELMDELEGYYLSDLVHRCKC